MLEYAKTPAQMKKYLSILGIFCGFLTLLPIGLAKDKKDKSESDLVMVWPDAEKPTLKLTFGKFTQMAAYNGQVSLGTAVLVENVSGKAIPQASFTVYLLDKDRVRIGNGNLNISDLEPGQQVKIPFQVFAVGTPSSLSLVARNSAGGLPTSLRTIPLKVISVPPGARLKVDGHEEGVTPKMVNLTVGTHTLEFSKEEYSSGSTPVEIKPDDLPGGSITFEMGGISRDTVELRDGTVVSGDVISLSLTSVAIRVDGKDQTIDRNQVKKILLVQRETVQQPPVVQPAPPAKQ